ncbi:hypothetical protein [Catelliglobosispora koreensis]|uniref:hypothetical protein n=1 Tax=Catelliglobosispora koreensis TaxID=129052 RepID=UPI000361AC07|nr:hypothetical protein [Catelliglobosispora koreensis]
MHVDEKPGLLKTSIWLAISGILILIITFFFKPTDGACIMRVGGECALPSATPYGLVIGMFVLTWAAIFYAAHRIITALRGR